MTMVSTGPISLGGTATSGGLNQSVNVELGRSGTATINMNESAVRTLAGVPSGAISMNNFYGKSNRSTASFTYASNTQQASLNITSLSGYVAGSTDITITVNSGVYLWSDDVAVAGLTLTGGTAGDNVTLVNNGFIMGRGGDGGYGATTGQTGGTALSLGFNTTVNNTNGSAYIGGGGGGGGGGRTDGTSAFNRTGGGGGGAGGAVGGLGIGTSRIDGTGGGGAGGSIGNVGANGTQTNPPTGGGAGGGGGTTRSNLSTTGSFANGAGGGRIFPGTGGLGGTPYANGRGGNGGSENNPGGIGVYVSITAAYCGGGGGWGASGGNYLNGGNSAGLTGGAGGAGGRAVLLNGNSVTWTSGNTTRVYGAVS